LCLAGRPEEVRLRAATAPQEVEIPEEGKTKAKERREVGEGDDTVVVEDTSDEDEDEETLQDRFQLRSSSAVLAYLMSPSCRIHRLAWRLVWPRRRGSRTMHPASVCRRS
jgi:hypothetical protein